MNAIVLVNIYDEVDQKYIANDITLRQAADLLCTTYKNTSWAKNRKYLVQGRYRVIHSQTIQKPKEEKEKKLSYEEWFYEQWEEAVRPFRELARGKASV